MVKFSLRYSRMQRRFGSFLPLLLGMGALIAIFFAAIFCYMRIEGWSFRDSFFMVVITLSTVGYNEVNDLSPTGEMFTAGLIFVGVGTFMFMAGSIAQLLVEGKLHQVLGRRRVLKGISRLNNHFIVCGHGRIGSVVAKEIANDGHPVVVIENDPDTLESLEECGYYFLSGDATSDELLLAAGVERARCLITTLSKDSANVYVVLTVKQLNPGLFVVSRAGTEVQISRLERAGADKVVMPYMIGGMRMAQTVLRPTVTSFVELAVRGSVSLQMEELLVSDRSEVVGKDLIKSEIRSRFNVILIGIKDKEEQMTFNPPATYVLQPGDRLLAVGGKENLKKLQGIL